MINDFTLEINRVKGNDELLVNYVETYQNPSIPSEIGNTDGERVIKIKSGAKTGGAKHDQWKHTKSLQIKRAKGNDELISMPHYQYLLA